MPPQKKTPAKKPTPKKSPAKKVGTRKPTPKKGSIMGDVAREVLIRAGVDIVDALRTTIEYGIELFCREAGWIALNTTTANFTSGKVKQLSFHQTGTMPGQIRAKAYQFATDMQTDLYSFGYSATGTTVQQIADIAQDPERTMQELLDAAVAGYVKNV